MRQSLSAKENFQAILENKGGETADKAIKILINDPSLIQLKQELEFISKNWRDPLRPTLIRLACESVGGKEEKAKNPALAMSLMNLTFYIWDDIIDKSHSRLFRPTLFGRFGEETALIIGGLASAKAFTIVNKIQTNRATHLEISELLWAMWANMATTEKINLQNRKKEYTAMDKYSKIEKEAAADMETCLRIGGLVGDGSTSEVEHLGKYGFLMGIIFELNHDLQVTLNQTLELADKIRTGALPYALLLSIEKSPKVQEDFETICCKKKIGAKETKIIINDVFQTNTINEIEHLINTMKKDAICELKEIMKNSASRALQTLASLQLQLLRETIYL
jgi:geranylgeranyl pyrophosphate synthase